MSAPLPLDGHFKLHAGEGALEGDLDLCCINLQLIVFCLLLRPQLLKLLICLIISDNWHIIGHKVNNIGRLDRFADE